MSKTIIEKKQNAMNLRQMAIDVMRSSVKMKDRGEEMPEEAVKLALSTIDFINELMDSYQSKSGA